ncbi:MAG: ATP-binding protein [Minwuia sp.]|nr:ATP-binding protein [Minwuia sp.]
MSEDTSTIWNGHWMRLLRFELILALPSAAMFGGLSVNAAIRPLTALVCWVLLNLVMLAMLHYLLRENDTLKARRRRPANTRDYAAAVERLGSDLAEARARSQADAAALRAILDGIERPVLTFDVRRRLEFMNLAAKSLFGSGLEGRDVAAALRHPDVLQAVDQSVSDRVSRTAEFPVFAPVRRRFRVTIDALPARFAGGQGFVAAVDDVTDSRQVQEMRSGFVADVSHELRTPLAAVMSIVDTLQGPARNDPDAQTRFLDILREQSDRMARLVDDLLALSRIEMNEHQPPRDTINLARLLDEVCESLDLLAQAREMRLERAFAPDLPVAGDRDELVRLFQNLIDNGIKYGDRGTPVRVSAIVDDGHVTVDVRDQGPGIAREQIPRLTERFYRTDRARSRAAGGTGLGLAIVKHIVSRHRGELSIRSQQGEGSCFSVRFPLSEPRSVAESESMLDNA